MVSLARARWRRRAALRFLRRVSAAGHRQAALETVDPVGPVAGPGSTAQNPEEDEHEQTVDVTAGDLLYLPPHVAHDGVAMQDEGFCTTYSVGFSRTDASGNCRRFPRLAGRNQRNRGRLSDPDLPATANPARVPKQYQRQIADAIAALQIDRDAIAQFAGCFASDPKPQVTFRPPDAPCRAAPSASLHWMQTKAALLCSRRALSIR